MTRPGIEPMSPGPLANTDPQGDITNKQTNNNNDNNIQIRALVRSARKLRKSSGNLRRLAVSQTPAKDHYLMLV